MGGKIINPRPTFVVNGREVSDPMEALMLVHQSLQAQIAQVHTEFMTKFESLMVAIEQEAPTLNQRFRAVLMERISFQLHRTQDVLRAQGELEGLKGIGEQIKKLREEAVGEGLEGSFKLGKMKYNQFKVRQEIHKSADDEGLKNGDNLS